MRNIFLSSTGKIIISFIVLGIFSFINTNAFTVSSKTNPIKTLVMNQEKNQELTKEDYKYLRRCLELAEEAYLAGDEPFGSILVNAKGEIIAEARNRVNEINVLAHPEYELAKWAVENLSTEERKQTKMYTTGEHCPMCAGAHGWVGLGDLIYLSSAEQLTKWLKEEGATGSAIQFTPSEEIINNITIKGPGEGDLLKRIKDLQIKNFHRNQ